MTPDSPDAGGGEPLVPFSRLGGFIRLVTHDVRNGLNAIDLEAALIAELSTDAEVLEELKRLRGMISGITKNLQTLSSRFAEMRLNPMVCPVHDFMEVCRERLAKRFPEQGAGIVWKIEGEDARVHMDFELLIAALAEVLQNAFQFRGAAPADAAGAVEFHARPAGREFVFEVRAPLVARDAAAPESWGMEPLVSTRRGGYGLGLFHARRIVAALGGRLEAGAAEAAGTVSTRIYLPAEPGRAAATAA